MFQQCLIDIHEVPSLVYILEYKKEYKVNPQAVIMVRKEAKKKLIRTKCFGEVSYTIKGSFSNLRTFQHDFPISLERNGFRKSYFRNSHRKPEEPLQPANGLEIYSSHSGNSRVRIRWVGNYRYDRDDRFLSYHLEIENIRVTAYNLNENLES